MKLIDISTPKHPNTFTMVDDADFEWISRWEWHVIPCGGKRNFYAGRCRTIICDSRKKRHTILLHREILQAEGIVDHQDGNGLNNTRSNLRLATFSENRRNSRKPIGARYGVTSRFKGVHWCGRDSRYRAQIGHLGKTYPLGTFKAEEDAAWAYDRAARQKFGPFARTNFPPPPMVISQVQQ